MSDPLRQALALHQAGRLAEAAALYAAVRRIQPDNWTAAYYGGVAALQSSRPAEAAALLRRAVALRPDHADGRGNLTVALEALARLAEAQGKPAEAVAACREGLCWQPDSADLLNGLGNALRALGRMAESAAVLRRAVRCRPQAPELPINLGLTLHAMGRGEEAVAVLEAAHATQPDDLAILWQRTLSLLPKIYRSEDHIDTVRRAYADGLADLTARLDARPERAGGLVPVVAALQPYYLPYQGRCDRDLQGLYGRLVCRVMAAGGLAPPPPPPRQRAPGEPLRVGLASAWLCGHSNWKIPIRGWLAGLDPQRFQVFGYFTGARRDAITDEAKSLCHRFAEGPRTLPQWIAAITGDRLDLLIFPEIGMDPATARLAALRLAPVQCSSWGHPQTSGYPTIDYFLSSDLMEPPGAEAHYSERLVRLPNLSFAYGPAPEAPALVTRAEIGLAEEAVFFWCCQSLYKYLPRHDVLFARIAARLPAARFVFLENPEAAVTQVFRQRLDDAFAALGLEAGRHCLFLPQQPTARFAGLCRLADVFLDSVGWSGCNSTLESLAFGTPVVTLPGALMRGRHSAAILSRLGLTDTIAADADDYVALAVALGSDPARRAAWRARALERLPLVQDDPAPARGLAAFLEEAAVSPPPPLQPSPGRCG